MDREPTQEELREMTRLDCEQVDKEIEEEEKEAAEKARREEEKHYCSHKQFEDAIINYDPEKDFKPSLLCGCACPEGSISIGFFVIRQATQKVAENIA